MSTAVESSTHKQRMQERFLNSVALASSRCCGRNSLFVVAQTVNLLSIISTSLTKDIVSKHFAVEVQNEGSVQLQLDYNGKKMHLRTYVGGYVTMVLHTRLEKSYNEKKRELCAYLTEMNDVDPDDTCDD